MTGRTTFVIAHRLSTIRRADQILVVEKGEIVERGTHETLIRREGRYHAMYTTQHGLTANLFLSPGEESKAAPKEEDRADKARGEGVPVGGQRVLEILRE
jgi:subfamily B ATP-binding cassette protein MsbA